MAKSHCRLLIKVNRALVANFNRFTVYSQNKILAKISEFTVPNPGPQPCHEKTYKMSVCSADSDQLGHPHSLISLCSALNG